ncbi:MAG: hypothetical protein LBR98_00985 [Syntrophomonadaceae bacterium]|jgi:hypothetical protein|nr:hypothetical protein [Syntrophomonadaceae bacterium]
MKDTISAWQKYNKSILALIVVLALAVTGFSAYNNQKINAGTEPADQEKIISLIYDFHALTQNTNDPDEEDKRVFKQYYEDMNRLNGAAPENEGLQLALRQYSIQAKERKTQANQKRLRELCTQNLIDRYDDAFDLNKSVILLNGLGGAGVTALKIEKCEINNNKAVIIADVTLTAGYQLTTGKGEKFNRIVEGTGYERFDFVKMNNQWYIDDFDIIDPHFENNKYQNIPVDPARDEITEEFIIDPIIEHATETNDDQAKIDKDVINYGSN